MTDDELIAAFETTELPAEQFSHEAHVLVAWWYLRTTALPEALKRSSTALRRFANSAGAPSPRARTTDEPELRSKAVADVDHPVGEVFGPT